MHVLLLHDWASGNCCGCYAKYKEQFVKVQVCCDCSYNSSKAEKYNIHVKMRENTLKYQSPSMMLHTYIY